MREQLARGGGRVLGAASLAARHADDFRVVVRQEEKRDRQPARDPPGVHRRIHHPVHGRDKTVVGPAHHDVADVDHERIRDAFDVDHLARGRVHLQAAGRVVDAQDRDCGGVGVRRRALLARLGGGMKLGVVDHPKNAGVAVDLVQKIRIGHIERLREYPQDVARQAFHLAVIVDHRLLHAVRFLRPVVGRKAEPRLFAVVVGIVSGIQRPDRVALVQRGLEGRVAVLAHRLQALR